MYYNIKSRLVCWFCLVVATCSCRAAVNDAGYTDGVVVIRSHLHLGKEYKREKLQYRNTINKLE
jgi:hypothetical protein